MAMSSEACLLALNCALDEVKHACPSVQHAFLFKPDAQLVAKDNETDEAAVNVAVQAVQAVGKRAQAFGGLESITFQGADYKVAVTCMNNFSLVTVSDHEVDEQTLRMLTNVLVPTVVKVLQIVHPDTAEKTTEETDALTETDHEVLEDNQEATPEVEACPEPPTEPQIPLDQESTSDPMHTDAPASQLMVETLSGFGLVTCSSNVVRIDSEVLARWRNLYSDQKIIAVEVEEPQVGKRLRCGFKSVRDQRLEGKGVIQISEKLQQLLETRKGALVTVKPIIVGTEENV